MLLIKHAMKLTPPTPLSASSATLYKQLGGTAAVDAAVDIFYRRVLSDAYVTPFFEGIDMDKQAGKQKAFLTMVLGGPNNYTGLDMREGHKHLVDQGLNASHFEHILTYIERVVYLFFKKIIYIIKQHVID